MRGSLCPPSNAYHRPPRYTSSHAEKSIGVGFGGTPMSPRYPVGISAGTFKARSIVMAGELIPTDAALLLADFRRRLRRTRVLVAKLHVPMYPVHHRLHAFPCRRRFAEEVHAICDIESTSQYRLASRKRMQSMGRSSIGCSSAPSIFGHVRPSPRSRCRSAGGAFPAAAQSARALPKSSMNIFARRAARS